MPTARVQFGEPIAAFPRISDKLAMMATEIMIAPASLIMRASRRIPDGAAIFEAGNRLLAARGSPGRRPTMHQVHGGNGFALEFPISRILCDARILNIFEGAAKSRPM